MWICRTFVIICISNLIQSRRVFHLSTSPSSLNGRKPWCIFSSGGINNDGARVVCVGGGAAGIELCLAMRARWTALFDSKLSITLIDSNNMLLPSETSACRSALKNVMEKYDIGVHHSYVVDEVLPSHIRVRSNSNNMGERTENIPYTHCIWATGAEAHKLSWDLHKQCGLEVSANRGWIRVNQKLQSLSHPSLFAAGDCCEIVSENGRSPPKAGVYAVRSGPILAENLTRYLGIANHSRTEGLVPYHPQDDFLKLLMCGDGTALGFRFGIPCEQFMETIDVDSLQLCLSHFHSSLQKADEFIDYPSRFICSIISTCSLWKVGL